MDYLPLVQVLCEVELWFHAPTDWLATWARQPRNSLANEVLLGLGNLGPSVRSVAGGAVEATERSAATWKAADHNELQSALSALRSDLETLKAALFTVEGLGASWADLVSCHENAIRNWRRRERLLDFVALAAAVGHDPRWFCYELAGLIRDEAHTVGAVRERQYGTPFDFSAVGSHSGSTLTELDELLNVALCREPLVGHCVVWLDYVDADLGAASHVDAGEVQYWRASYVAGLAHDLTSELPSPLDELRTHGVTRALVRDEARVPEHSVWARVDLGTRHPVRADEEAHQRAILLADLAAVRAGGPRWRRGGWAEVLIDNESASSGISKDRTRYPPSPDHMRMVGDHLAELAGSAAWSSPPKAALGRVARLWADVESHNSPADRVPAVVRVIDSLLDNGVKNRSLRSTLPKVVAWEQQSEFFGKPILEAVRALAIDAGMYRGAPEPFANLLPEGRQIWTSELVPILAILRRELKGPAERFAADLEHSWRLVDDRHEQRRDFDTLLARHSLCWQRVLRYRNSVTHGSPAPLDTGKVAAKTAETVGLTVVDAALASADSQRDIPSELQRSAQWARVPGWAREAR